MGYEQAIHNSIHAVGAFPGGALYNCPTAISYSGFGTNSIAYQSSITHPAADTNSLSPGQSHPHILTYRTTFPHPHDDCYSGPCSHFGEAILSRGTRQRPVLPDSAPPT